jgi:aminoglycoside/choline kinase family phosphotransferase
LRPDSLSLASADASFRRYLRLEAVPGAAVGESAIVMDAPPDKENCEPFVRIARLMADAGLQVPQILEWDEPQGFMLLNDLGQHTMMAVIQAAAPAEYHTEPYEFWPRPAPSAAVEAMYRQAIDLLVQWQLASKPGVLPAYDEALLQRELSLFPDWYLGQHKGIDLAASTQHKHQQTLQEAFARITANNLASPQVFVHRDFMPRNLMAPTRTTSPEASLGVLDFQDAVYGPVTYDIASLMRDAFLTWDEGFVIDVTVRYWEKARKAGLLNFEDWSDNFGDFYRSVEWMGLQRHLKVAGIFARLTLRDGKPKYLADAPRFIGYIRSTASRYRELTPLLRMIDEVENIQPLVGYAYGRMS